MPAAISIEPVRRGRAVAYRVTDGRRTRDIGPTDPGYGACRRLHAVVEGHVPARTAAAVEDAALFVLRHALDTRPPRAVEDAPAPPGEAQTRRARG